MKKILNKIKTTAIVLITILLFMQLPLVSYNKRETKNTIPINEIKLTSAKNFISNLTQQMDGAVWDFGKARRMERDNWAFFSGRIELYNKKQECSPQTSNQFDATLNKFTNIEVHVKETISNERYFCIDDNILVEIHLFSIPERKHCHIGFTAEWSDNTDCQKLILKYY